jgi:hypothetical protein
VQPAFATDNRNVVVRRAKFKSWFIVRYKRFFLKIFVQKNSIEKIKNLGIRYLVYRYQVPGTRYYPQYLVVLCTGRVK